MTRAIIFGINGQDGFYLNKLLQEKNILVTGVSRSSGKWEQGDVGNRHFVESLIKEQKPSYIFHFAANSKTNHELIFEHKSTIVEGTLNILESAYKHSPSSKVFITGSGLQFQNTGRPIKETEGFIATDAYSLARIQSVYTARYYRSKGVKAYTGYLFHHDSPLRTASHLNRKIADAAIAAGEGREYTLSIADISVEKEFGFAGDIVQGILHLVEQEDFFEACIGTGKAYSIGKWLELCFSSTGKNWKDFVQHDELYVPAFKRMVSDSSLLQSSGWVPATSIEDLANMMLKPFSNRG